MNKILIACLALSFSLTSFAQDIKFLEFGEILFKSFEYRLEVLDNTEFINRILDKDHTLTGEELQILNSEAMKRFDLGDRGLEFLEQYEHHVKKRVKKKYKPSSKDLKEVMMFLGLATTMSDSFFYAYLQFNKNGKLRKILNEKNQAYQKEKKLFKKSVKRFYSAKNRKKIRRAIKIYKKFFKGSDYVNSDDDIITVSRVIESSYTYTRLSDQNFFGKTGEVFKVFGKKIGNSLKAQADFFNNVTSKFIFGGSKLFGNYAGSFQSRRGKLYKDEQFLSYITPKLKPMDVILEKTPFRLTDKFIPGYWGHAAVYIGNEGELKELGIWDHPVVKKFHRKIKAGRFIVEALRSDVEINTIKHFSDIDDYAHLVLKQPLTDEETAEHIIRALQQVGKKYDFGFDVETGETIVCTELHYSIFTRVDFNTDRIIGRQTISVDQVAEQGLSGGPFEPVVLYIDGIEVTENIQEAYDSVLIKEKVNEAVKAAATL